MRLLAGLLGLAACDARDVDEGGGVRGACFQVDGADDCDGDGVGADDCDDTDPRASVTAIGYLDRDGDGYGAAATATDVCGVAEGLVADGTDCDDDEAEVHPGAVEVCDALSADENCDGVADDADPDVLDEGREDFWPDVDGDGYGDLGADATRACRAPAGVWVSETSDCDDTNAAVHPGANEVCRNGLDDDCDQSAGRCVLDDADLVDADAVLVGAQDHMEAGHSVAGVGDVDADGYDDVLVGAPGYTEDCDTCGAAFLIRGQAAPGSGDLADLALLYTGENGGGVTGNGVAGAGDVNGDGIADMLVGADGEGTLGAVYVGLGRVTWVSMPLADWDATWSGVEEDDRTGFAVDGVGDYDGDGIDDLVIGAFGTEHEDGAVYLVRGDAAFTSGSLADADAAWAGRNGEAAGQGAAGAGDVDGDGLGDVIIGAPAYGGYDVNEGAAYLVRGQSDPLTGELTDADAVYTAEEPGAYTGRGVDGAGDVDADGYADVLVGAWGATRDGSDSGVVYLLRGDAITRDRDLADADAIFAGEDRGDRAGYAVSGAGDVDGDGFADVVIGGYLSAVNGRDAGAAYVVLGGPTPASRSLADADARLTGSGSEGAGHEVSGAGDVDADGFDDLLVGAGSNSGRGFESGAAYLVRGIGL